jgi:hypothetical protein
MTGVGVATGDRGGAAGVFTALGVLVGGGVGGVFGMLAV